MLNPSELDHPVTEMADLSLSDGDDSGVTLGNGAAV
jgi:hypothetical protein